LPPRVDSASLIFPAGISLRRFFQAASPIFAHSEICPAIVAQSPRWSDVFPSPFLLCFLCCVSTTLLFFDIKNFRFFERLENWDKVQITQLRLFFVVRIKEYGFRTSLGPSYFVGNTVHVLLLLTLCIFSLFFPRMASMWLIRTLTTRR